MMPAKGLTKPNGLIIIQSPKERQQALAPIVSEATVHNCDLTDCITLRDSELSPDEHHGLAFLHFSKHNYFPNVKVPALTCPTTYPD